MLNKTHIVQFLSLTEIICKCGCGFYVVNYELARMFQRARELFGEPIKVTSGCRCAKHNSSSKVRGNPNSSHLTGLALDVTCNNPTVFRLFRLAICLAWAGYRRIGFHAVKKFIHVDVDKGKAPYVVFEY